MTSSDDAAKIPGFGFPSGFVIPHSGFLCHSSFNGRVSDGKAGNVSLSGLVKFMWNSAEMGETCKKKPLQTGSNDWIKNQPVLFAKVKAAAAGTMNAVNRPVYPLDG